MAFKYIELFAGIGGFRSALDPLGGECVFASEIDPFATRAYKALYNGAPELHGDITKIPAEDIPDHDVLVGGFPCQAFSVAGQRKGFEEARGTLFFEIARIAKTKQPRLMLLENVKGLLSHDGGRTFETMCAVLNDIGYAIDFRVLNSKHFGVPHNRERIFVACDRDAEYAEWNPVGNGVEAKAKRRAQTLEIRTFNFEWPTDSAVTTRLRDVLEAQVDEKYYLSEEKTTKLIAQLNGRGDSAEPIVHASLNHYGNDQMNRVYSVNGVAPTITVVSGGGREQKIAEPQIYQRPRGNNDGGLHEIAPTLTSHSYQDNNHLMEPVVNDRGNLRTNEDGVSNALDANYAKGFDNHGQRTHVLEKPRYRIRKLTPRECWRLQGFSDAAHDTVAAAGVSDSQRYKQAGNAVTINVISAIGIPLVERLIGEEFTILEVAA